MIYFTEYNYNQIKDKVAGLLKKRDKYYLNNILTFDTETTTIYKFGDRWDIFDPDPPIEHKDPNNKGLYYKEINDYYTTIQSVSFVYEWTFGYENVVYYGRYLEDFKKLMDHILHDLRQHFSNITDEDLRTIIYIHNMPYDMQFLFNIYDVAESFQRKPHKQIYMLTTDGIEFRDSYIYANLSLDSISKSNENYKKISGYDYIKLRFPWTPMTEEELLYCRNDILSLWEYLTKEKETYHKRITSLPLTNTGKVRKGMTARVNLEDRSLFYKYQKLIPPIGIYKDMLQLFMGGVAHLNPIYNGQLLIDVKSRDYTSSYPFVLLTEKYPVSQFVKWSGGFNKIKNNKNIAWYATMDIYNFKCINGFPYLPNYKIMKSEGVKIDNGRVFSGKHFRMLVTNVDYEIIVANYNLQPEQYQLSNIYIATADYLPEVTRNYILDLYVDKTRYKDDPENTDLYANAKNKFNSIYGMNVTQLIAPEVTFINEKKDFYIEDFNDEIMQQQIEELKKKKCTITSFPIGVWCTAYARRNLYLGLNALPAMASIYTDTDSIKYLDPDGSLDVVFERINEMNYNKLKEALPDHLFNKVDPCDIHGVPHLIGEFAEEQGYKEFKSFGAKKYAYVQPDKNGKDQIHITVAGLNKKKGADKLHSLDDFKLGQVWNYEESGRTIAKYNTDQPEIKIDGHKLNYKYGVVLQPTTYKLGIGKEYDSFLLELQKGYVEFNKTGVFRDV